MRLRLVHGGASDELDSSHGNLGAAGRLFSLVFLVAGFISLARIAVQTLSKCFSINIEAWKRYKETNLSSQRQVVFKSSRIGDIVFIICRELQLL